MKPAMPPGMVIVSQEEFFSLLKADGRDIMPCLASPDYTTWESPHREVWGWTLPGWKNPGEPRVYAVVRSAKETPWDRLAEIAARAPDWAIKARDELATEHEKKN